MRSNQIKKLIIEKTKELLKKNKNVTIKEIADACYVNIASVNYYFGSKDALLKIVTEEFIENLKVSLMEIIIEQEGPNYIENTLRKTIQLLLERFLENAGIMSYLLENIGNEQGNILKDLFFTENEFTEQIFTVFKQTTEEQNQMRLEARYIILFASFILPLVLSLSLEDETLEYYARQNFTDVYLEELVHVIKYKHGEEWDQVVLFFYQINRWYDENSF